MERVGQEFYEMISDIGENVVFYLKDKVVQQRMSVRIGKENFSTEGNHLKTGVMTFDNLGQQVDLQGEYFKKESNENIINILLQVTDEPHCNGRIGQIYCAECNEVIDIISYYDKTKDPVFGDFTEAPNYIGKGINVFIKASTREQLESKFGSFIETTTTIYIPAKYKVTTENTILRNKFAFDETQKQNVVKKVKYKIESIDDTMVKMGTDGEFKGVLKCLITESKE